jgi:chromatin segregation and condensation protein Rec8/ScpA/Scc1 (kleisin family)
MADDAAEVDVEDLTLQDLAEAYARIAATVNFDRLGEHAITYDETPIELHAEDILDHLRREGRGVMPLAELFRGRTTSEMIGLFLATLELVRRGDVTVTQQGDGGPIVLAIVPPAAGEPGPA